MDRQAEDLKRRTKAFLLKIPDLIETLPAGSPGVRRIIDQLAGAGCGVAGNYRADCRARSHPEFTARIGVVLEEADEAELWLSVVDDRAWGDEALRAWLLDEAVQLRSIFAKAYEPARDRETRRNHRT